jgi:topoisomerase IV subunit A
MEEDSASVGQESTQELHHTVQLSGMYKSWFLEYASYVILERAVPEVLDGLKPVQRRILHAMKELDDGRFNKVANVIGHTMQYHPHGDASIGDALVQLGQKDLLIDMQGNWGNVHTGDSAAAPRYIEARLSRFALDTVFNPKTTNWRSSYDGRKKEPITLPVKFPLLLAQGVEGIAVGLASKILPHNFLELIDASIACLKGEDFELYPDFPTAGMADCSRYNEGHRGGRVRIRARISKLNPKTLLISEIPFGTTTGSLIESIVSANDKGKIKIRKIEDNTAANVEILIHLQAGVSPDQTIDALYAFTQCEVSISPNTCVIYKGKPAFLGVKEILQISTDATLALLKLELEIQLRELMESWHFSSLEKIFIEKRIYRKIEECETWEAVLETIDKGLAPYRKLFKRDITQDDIIRLTEIKIKRISRFDSFKADEVIRSIEDDIDQVQQHLANLVNYAIDYYERIRKKYGAGRERRTELRSFETILASAVAADTSKLYVNRLEGFAGSSLKKDEYVCDCSDLDDILVIRADGTLLVKKIADKIFFGKDIVHIAIFKRNDDRTIYNVVYQDGKAGYAFMKRFAVQGITRDKEYDLTQGKAGSRILYLTANPNGEAEVVRVLLRPQPKLKKLAFDLDFSSLDIKGRASKGNILSKHKIKKIFKKEEGVSTLGAINIWYDETVKRLNTDSRGRLLGSFMGDDRLIMFNASGFYRTSPYDLSTHFDDDMLHLEKYHPRRVYTAIYLSPESGSHYLKRFEAEPMVKNQDYLPEPGKDQLVHLIPNPNPRFKLVFDTANAPKQKESEDIESESFIAVKSARAKGKRLSNFKVQRIDLLDPGFSELPEESMDESLEMVEMIDVEAGESSEDTVEPAVEQITSVEPEVIDSESDIENDGMNEGLDDAPDTATDPLEQGSPTSSSKDEEKKKPGSSTAQQMSLF